MMTQSRKPVKKTVLKICLWQVKSGTQFKHEGETYLKVRAKTGMTANGKVVTLADATMVEPVN